jgi:hypothetical protein
MSDFGTATLEVKSLVQNRELLAHSQLVLGQARGSSFYSQFNCRLSIRGAGGVAGGWPPAEGVARHLGPGVGGDFPLLIRKSQASLYS